MKRSILFIVILFILAGCKEKHEYLALDDPETRVNWNPAREYYLVALQQAIIKLSSIRELGAENDKSRQLFKEAREYWKKAEPFAAYLNPPVGHRVNGPALPVFKEDNSRIMPPIGLQKIEESIYDGGESLENFDEEVKVTLGLMNNLESNIQKREINPERFFVSIHQQLLRILSHSLSGFDTPVSKLGIKEAAISLQSLKEVYQLSIQPLIMEKDEELDELFLKQVEEAIKFIGPDPDFEEFDRYTFIRDFLNPITKSWVQIRITSNLWKGTDTKPFNFDAPSFFEEDSFNTKYFMEAVNRKESNAKIALGQRLFYDEKLSKKGNMSCATCHKPDKAFADGIAFNLDNDGKRLDRNTPTLINSVYQKGFFWDGRSEGLMEQISSVFVNEREFDAGVHEFSSEILEDSSYIKLFKDTFGRMPRGNTDVIKALASYIATLNGMNSKFDRNIRGEEDSFTTLEKKGFNLFMGKALCATCHFMPLTNGTVPPFFSETEKEVIGVPATASNLVLDEDTGFYWRYKLEEHKGMFKTPTVRNAEVTAPYMHNGIYNTLEEVIDFYNNGGGAGLGFNLPHQTLPFDNLELTEVEQEALVAYLKTLTDENVEGQNSDPTVAVN